MDKCELYDRGLDPSWRVVVLDDDECKSFFEERLLLNDYKDEFFEYGEFVEEWDDGNQRIINHFVPVVFRVLLIMRILKISNIN